MAKAFLKTLLCAALFSISAALFAQESAEPPAKPPRDALFEVGVPDFSASSYSKAVASLFKAFEKDWGHSISKGKKGKVGIKVYTNSGPGIDTPKELVDAVIDQLEKRGYKKSDITIVDMSRRKLRECGFLPKYSELRAGKPDNYGGVNVADIESRKFFDKNWFYDNPLTPKSVRGMTGIGELYNPELRKSYLPVPLFLTVDFWINLPVITDMEGLGVCAALGNASIWNMSNNERFLKSPANASMAAAEVCAIPELNGSHMFTILSLEKGQFVGGAVFNSRCTFSEPKILLSANPVAVDFIAYELINKSRRAFGFSPIDPQPPVLNYCKELGVGDWDFRKIRRVNVPYSSKRQ